MLGKLLALLAQAKAAGVTLVVVAAGATVTVAGTTPEVQDQLQQLTANISQLVKSECDTDRGQPEVVAQRNSADKFLRAAWQKDHKALEDLRGGKDVDNQAVGVIVKKYDGLLSERLDKAINDVAALTQGRNGQLKASASPSGSPASTTSPTPTPTATPTSTASATPSCTPKPSASASASPAASPSPSASGSPASGSGKPEQQGRVTVAERTTLDAAIQSIVDLAIKDMDDLVKKATDEAAKVPAPERGKPSDKGKPSENPGNKPEDKGKPSGAPGKP
jgi:hypothetical protein